MTKSPKSSKNSNQVNLKWCRQSLSENESRWLTTQIVDSPNTRRSKTQTSSSRPKSQKSGATPGWMRAQATQDYTSNQMPLRSRNTSRMLASHRWWRKATLNCRNSRWRRLELTTWKTSSENTTRFAGIPIEGPPYNHPMCPDRYFLRPSRTTKSTQWTSPIFGALKSANRSPA